MNKELGAGFLESVYHEALAFELDNKEIPFVLEKKLEVNYKGKALSKYYIADFICYGKIIIEIKAINEFSGVHESQVINYLKATGFKLGLLINFGAESLEYKRIVRH